MNLGVFRRVVVENLEAVVNVLGWVFKRTQENFGLLSRPIEEWRSFGNGNSFDAGHRRLTVLRLAAENAEGSIRQQTVDDVWNGCGLALGECREGLANFENELRFWH